jgi:hypothetical protein
VVLFCWGLNCRSSTLFQNQHCAGAVRNSVQRRNYYLIYLPKRDAEADLLRSLEAARIESQKRDERQQAAFEQREREDRLAREKSAIQSRYRFCLRTAEDIYERRGRRDVSVSLKRNERGTQVA